MGKLLWKAWMSEIEMSEDSVHENNLEAEGFDVNKNKGGKDGSVGARVMCESKRIGRLRGRGKEYRERASRHVGRVEGELKRIFYLAIVFPYSVYLCISFHRKKR